MFCAICGAYNDDQQRYCSQCGSSLGQASAQTTVSESNFTMPVTPGGPGYQGNSYDGDMTDPSWSVQQTQAQPEQYQPMQPMMAPVAPHIDARRREGQIAPFLIGLASTLLVAGLAALLFFVGPFGSHGGSEQNDSGSAEDPLNETPEESTPEDPSSDDATDDSTDDPDKEDASNAPQYKASLSDYSWDELSQIAKLIEECSSSSDALAIAKDYNLVSPSGSYPSNTKSIKMSDGKTVRVELVGVWHDDADTSSGKAGLSFLAIDTAYTHRMASGKTTPGGWQGSELRSWMQADLYGKLPQELSSCIVPVYKLSNNTGKTSSLASVTKTLDAMWVPSIVEVCGPVNWRFDSDPSNSPFYNSVFNAEGTQYEAFAQKGIRSEDPNACLQLGGGWWLRSTAASSGRGRHVSPQGDPSQFGDSSETWGVAFGFCL